MTTIADRLGRDPDNRLLIELLLQQNIIRGNELVAKAFASICTIMDVPRGKVIIRQDDVDNDIYFILSGRARILVHEHEVAARQSGQHVGEMALIDPSLRRTATVVACEDSVAAKVTESQFVDIANAYPYLWRNLAVELARRLDERRKFHRIPNATSQLFIGSSREGLNIAQALARHILPHVATVKIWSNGVFGASHFPMEDLSAMLLCSDFAALLVTADDNVTSRGKDAMAPRDNIVFELGLFMGAISRHRTFIVIPRGIDIKIPTDLLGINPVYYDPIASNIDDATRPAAEEIAAAITFGGPR